MDIGRSDGNMAIAGAQVVGFWLVSVVGQFNHRMAFLVTIAHKR